MQSNTTQIDSTLGFDSRQAEDPRCKEIVLTSPMPEGEAIPSRTYSDEDHGTWKLLYQRQRDFLKGRACPEFLTGLDMMNFSADRLPSLVDVHRTLRAKANWGLAHAPGLLSTKDFYSALARRVFASTNYIRARHEMDYTPAPDMFHDLFGHTPLLTDKYFGNFYQKFGQVAVRTSGQVHEWLANFYWFTVEFGLIQTRDGLRIYGNGILSSYKEAGYSLSGNVKHLPFNPQQMGEHYADISILQPVLYVIESFEQLETEFDRWTKSLGV